MVEPIQLGLIVNLALGPSEALRTVRDLGFPTCQIQCWDERLFNETTANQVSRAARDNDVDITSVWVGLPGRHVWDLIEGPTTIGLVQEETRAVRLNTLKRGSDFAQLLGAPSITTHVGFIPENPMDPLYSGLIESLRDVAFYCGGNQHSFWFETGQETPITLLRAIDDIGTDNLGINLDPANLLMYGKANPLDALDIIGAHVRGVHAKDGEYPTNGRKLGLEKRLGEGRVDFSALVLKLRSLGFNGALTIEREITGPQQIEDIRAGKRYLEQILEDEQKG